MAITKVYARRQKLYKCIEYALNADKTEQAIYRSVLNCCSTVTAYNDMQSTKKRYNKMRGVLGYHFIQSFAPNEVTPEQAHQIGVEFAKRCFGNDYEVVIGTHLDKEHLHNHIVINSVSFRNGKKYHSSPQSYYNTIRFQSDKLCQEHNLSVISSKGNGKHYAEWKAEKQGRPTLRGLIRNDIDEAIKKSFTYKNFIEEMKNTGYIVKYGLNIKHTAVKPKGSTRFFRLDTLGVGYTEEDIKEKLYQQQYEGKFRLSPISKKTVHAHFRGNYSKGHKITGLRALYLRYLYLLGKVKKHKPSKKISKFLYDDVIKFEKYVKQNRFLYENKIDTLQDLIDMKSFFCAKIDSLTTEREKLYKELKKRNEKSEDNEDYKRFIYELKDYRAKVRQCNAIIKDAERIQELLQKSQENKKEVNKNERRKSSGRTNDKPNFEDFRNSSKTNGIRS